ncbi:MAG: BTAD domain-containing putative transcriptional regulator [Gammaproteobacteria bacterium]|nr:BTAD domain-containing putative transcriptional regulator [Gammaproteobacteria bacterium]
MRALQLKLLGQFECSLSGDDRIPLSTRKAEVLLAFLALAPGLRHPRERLVNLLWSDRGEEQARNSLRQALSAMKKALGDSADLILQVDRNTVSLKSELIEVDAHEFERLGLEGDYESLSTAADLYQGEFLEGIQIRDPACEEWLDSERARFKRQYIDILKNLAETQLVTHDYSHAIQSAERLVKQDPLHESGWRLLMQACADSGERNRALQAFKRCEQILRDELGVEPEAETTALRAAIAGGKVRAKPEPAAEVRPQPTGKQSEHSIAVLPFDNLSGDPEQEYFSDGITDSIILNLSLFPTLKVKSRNSSFAFKQQIKSPGEISEALEVNYLVEGSIRKSGDRIRITVQLIDAGSSNQIWGKRYDAGIDNLFELEEELSRTIATTVTGQIGSDLERVALAKGASDQQAYDLLLAGEYHMNKFNGRDMVKAIDCLDRCLELDPGNVRAHAGLYFCHIMSWAERWIEDYEPAYQRAADHAEKAVELGNEHGEAHTAYAEYQIFCRDYEAAARHVEKALTINPNDTDALTTKAMNLEMQGKFEAAREVAKLAWQLDPYHPWADWILAESHFCCGEFEKALEIIAESKNAPSFIRLYNIAANVMLGRLDQARKTLQVFLENCRAGMLAMPRTLDEWMAYTIDNAPFADQSYNQQIIDCLVAAGLEDTLTPPAAKEADGGEPSVLVLPLENMSGDPEQDYFSDGITESLISALSASRGLAVKSRHTSFAHRNSTRSVRDLGAELGVDYIVEGSIRKNANQVRISVQLTEVESGNQIWGKRYDRPLDELFELEEELVRSLASAISGRIGREVRILASKKPAADMKSFDYLMRGWYVYEQHTPVALAKAIDFHKKALEIDPQNVMACALIAAVSEDLIFENWCDDRDETVAEIESHLSRALALDPNSALAHAIASDLAGLQRDREKERYHADRALELDPTWSYAHACKADCLASEGNLEDAVKLADVSMQLDEYQNEAGWPAGEVYRCAGMYQRAIEAFRTMPVLTPNVHAQIAACLVAQDLPDKARAEMAEYLQKAREYMPRVPASEEAWRDYFHYISTFPTEQAFDEYFDQLLQAGLCDDLQQDQVEQPSIVVLPFTNLSGDPEQEYFSDGFTESVILSLGSFPELGVKSRHASFAFKDSSRSIAEIADELGAQYIVEGSIRKRGERIGITVQLAETAGGDQLWGKRYDIAPEELIELEEELVQTIAGTISARIDRRIRLISAQKPARNLQSYDYLMRGWYHAERFNPEDYATAIDGMKQCLAIDPKNVNAHAILGATLNVLLTENWTTERDAISAEAGEHLRKALDLDGTDALAHAFMAEHQVFLRNFTRAMMHADKAIEHNPALPDGYNQKAWVLSAIGEHDEACKLAEFSLRSDPYHFYMAWNAGIVFRNAGDFRRSVDTFRLLPYPPPSVRAELAAALVGLGAMDEAREEMAQYLALARRQMPRFPDSVEVWRDCWSYVAGYESDDDFEAFFELLLRAGLGDDL